jgi:diguanylate cyclase (GGDEF)-like protein
MGWLVGKETGAGLGRRWFVGVTGSMTVAHPLLPTDVRSVNYLLVSAVTIVPISWLLRRLPRRDRRAWWVLLGAMSLLTAGNGLTAFGGVAQQANAELLVTLAHSALLVAAATMALRRGRNDVGGMLDVSVAAIGLGGLLWTALLFPRLTAMGSSVGEQVGLLVSILVLSGVLGALVRIWLVSDRRMPALSLLVVALMLALVGNTILATTTGSMTVGRPGWIEMFFLLAYICVGLTPLDGSVFELLRPGPAPADGLSVGRLIFLGAALVVGPVAGGFREIAGLPADGPLLALGSLLVVPLVMIRVGRLSAERTRAEAALRHQATHDLLTGLPNRGELLARLDAALDRERDTGRPRVVLLFCDLNGFKAVNDRLGHLAGDQLLTEVGARIRAGLRGGDTLARYGGDEFLVLCEDDAQQQAALRLGAHIERSVQEPFRLAGEQVRISTSVGAVLSDGDLRADELIRRADQAMYAAKQRAALNSR